MTAATKLGKCKLCGSLGELRESHIMPAWTYRRVKKLGAPPSGPVPQLLQAEYGSLRSTDEQARERMLCPDCEERFCRWEDRVARLAIQIDGRFPAIEVVDLYPGSLQPGHVADGDGSLLGRELGLFAASVVWRASAATTLFHDVSLGSYEQTFGDFVLERRDDLPCARLMVQLIEPAFGAFVPLSGRPCAWDEDGSQVHQIAVPGIILTFRVGVPALYDHACYLRTGKVSIIDGEQMRQEVMRAASRGVTKGTAGRRLNGR